MWEYIKQYMSKTHKVNPNEFVQALPQHNPFIHQRDMLKSEGDDSSGLCVSLSNLYVKTRLQGLEADYLKDKHTTYELAKKEEHHQGQLQEAGEKDVRHSAFSDSNIAHDDIDVTREQLTSPQEIKQLMGKSRFAMFSYPTRYNGAHQLVFENGQESNSPCRIFDADTIGGEQKHGDCDLMRQFLARTIEITYPESDERIPVVGLSK
jgi:hypothetical protein